MKKLLLTGIAALLPATGAPAANILLLDDINNPAIYLKIIGDLVKEDGDTFLGATDSHGFSDRSRGKPIYVVLESNGGLVVEGLKIGKAIYQRRYNTVVYNKCASTCALIWLAGANRWVAASGSVGFHAIYLAGTGEVSSAGNAMVGAYLLDIELSMTAIQYVTTAAPSSMEWLTSDKAKQFGIEMKVLKVNNEIFIHNNITAEYRCAALNKDRTRWRSRDLPQTHLRNR